MRAAIYARISSDQDGTALGVTRQLEDCRKLAKEVGWKVADEYVDNDLSAYSGKRRPSYERMLADLADGLCDAVIVYHADRLTRRPIELEQFLEVITTAGVRDVRFVAGAAVDVANGDGLLVLRMLAAVAANESESKSRRVRRKMVEVAQSGRPHGGSHRPFGFEDDRITHRPAEAKIIKAMARRYIAGESLRSIAAWLEEQGVPTPETAIWRTTALRHMLRSGRIAGLREHNGEVVGPAVWKPIISPSDRDKILARMQSAKTSGRRAPRRYLLSGLLRCGRCDGRLYSSARKETRRYVCTSGPDHGGCGGITVVAAPVEELIADAVLYRLDTAELADALAGRSAQDEQTAALSEAIAADRQQLDELAQLYATKQIGAREWMSARNPIDERIRDAERRLSRLTNTDQLTQLIGNGKQLRRQWASLNLDRQHTIVRSLLDHAVILPGTPGARGLDPNRVDAVWRI